MTEYILPHASHLAEDEDVSVRCAWASALSTLAETGRRFLELGESLKAVGGLGGGDEGEEVRSFTFIPSLSLFFALLIVLLAAQSPSDRPRPGPFRAPPAHPNFSCLAPLRYIFDCQTSFPPFHPILLCLLRSSQDGRAGPFSPLHLPQRLRLVAQGFVLRRHCRRGSVRRNGES
jgi:hypothetical protein